MKNLLTILFITLPFLTCFSQSTTEEARKYLIWWLPNPADSIYIEDRKKLERIAGHHCTSREVTFNDTSNAGGKIEIKIEVQEFLAFDHEMEIADTSYYSMHNSEGGWYKKAVYHLANTIIDGRESYGFDYSMPRYEIKTFSVTWNGVQLAIPDTAFSNLFEPHLCFDHVPGVEAYLTNDNKRLYIYISGGDAAGFYSVKMVFNRERYVTRLIRIQEDFDFLDRTWKPDE